MSNSAITRETSSAAGLLVLARPLAALLFVVGTLSRLVPLLEPHGRLLRQFMTEDGYLMQTVARNLALGLGMSVSDGTIQTNGVQPLATFLFSLCYMISGGDKIGGIAGVTIVSTLISLASAALLYALAKRVLKDFPDGHALALLVAALWFSSPLIVRHSMNGLETGLYFLISLATLNAFLAFVERNPSRFSLRQMLALGAMFGLCFLARNDAVFLIAAILAARFVLLWPRSAADWRNRMLEAAVPGLLSILIALPWLVYNYRLFGSIMPISGISESLNAKFAQNLGLIPAKLLEYVLIIFPIPRFAESSPLTILVSVLAVAAVVVLAGQILWTRARAWSYLVVVYGFFSTLLIAFYGLYFGAPYFLSRYFSVVSPFLAMASVLAAYRMLLVMRDGARRIALVAAAATCTIAAVGLNALLYQRGMRHDHFQVVNWVSAHVAPQTWAGAVQSGTLGFFHDRTLNLDGKVNPDALRAALTEGTVIPYVIRSKITYVIDWAPFAEWARIDTGGFDRKFRLVLVDKAANLAVLKRVDGSTR